LCLKLAQELGVSISNPWVSWFKAASVPAFVALMTTPFLLYKIFPPDIKEISFKQYIHIYGSFCPFSTYSKE
jgi:di/tricarboxylate transporter